MTPLIWAPEAICDVDRLYRYLADTDLAAAQRAVASIRRSVKALQDMPQAGRSMEDMPSPFREWLIPFGSSGYAAMYRYDGAMVVILAVKHQHEAGY